MYNRNKLAKALFYLLINTIFLWITLWGFQGVLCVQDECFFYPSLIIIVVHNVVHK